MQHIEVDHCQSANKRCAYCEKISTGFEKYQSHMNNKHGLPVWPASTIGSNDDNTTPDQPHHQV